jgi:hypothetical protein
MRRSRHVFAGAASLAVVFVLVTPLAVMAHDTPKHVGHSIVVSVGGNGSSIVLTADPSVKDKTTYNANNDAKAAGASRGMLSTYNSDGCGIPNCNPATLGNSNHSWVLPPGGQAQYIVARFSSSDPYCMPEFCVTFSGNSSASWNGTNPYYPDSMDLWDHWHVDAVNVSVGYPSGVGIAGSGGDANWSRSVGGGRYWTLSHYFSNIKFSAWSIWNIAEYAGGDFDFGNTTFSTQTDDSAYI